jgi:hypothetical protein
MNKSQEKSFLAFLLVLLSAGYVGYTAWRYLYSPMSTETVFLHTVTGSYETRGIALRDEALIPRSGTELIRYTREDSEVVKKGGVIAEAYRNEEALRWKNSEEQIQREIDLLLLAQSSHGETGFSDAIGAQINETAGLIIQAVGQTQLEQLDSQRDRIQLLLGKKQILTGRAENFSQTISILEEKRKMSESKTDLTADKILSPYTGYFCATVDGFEQTLSHQNYDTLTAAQIRGFIRQDAKPQTANESLGRIQTSLKWSIAADVPLADAEQFRENASVTIDFGYPDVDEVPVTIKKVLTDEEGAVVLFECDRINPFLISMRKADFTVVFRSYTGLRIPAEAVRFENSVQGVYVLEGRRIRYKPITVIRSADNFFLCEPDTLGGPKLYDEVVVRGRDLYEGKMVG